MVGAIAGRCQVLTDQQWESLARLLPRSEGRVGAISPTTAARSRGCCIGYGPGSPGRICRRCTGHGSDFWETLPEVLPGLRDTGEGLSGQSSTARDARRPECATASDPRQGRRSRTPDRSPDGEHRDRSTSAGDSVAMLRVDQTCGGLMAGGPAGCGAAGGAVLRVGVGGVAAVGSVADPTFRPVGCA